MTRITSSAAAPPGTIWSLRDHIQRIIQTSEECQYQVSTAGVWVSCTRARIWKAQPVYGSLAFLPVNIWPAPPFYGSSALVLVSGERSRSTCHLHCCQNLTSTAGERAPCTIVRIPRETCVRVTCSSSSIWPAQSMYGSLERKIYFSCPHENKV